MRHFKKSIPKNKLYLPTGGVVPFVEIGDGELAILATEDEEIISELLKFIKNQSGGVFDITPEEYDELVKKNSNLTPLIRPFNEQYRTSGLITQSVAAGLAEGNAVIESTLMNRFDERTSSAIVREASVPVEPEVTAPEPKLVVNLTEPEVNVGELK